MMKSHPYQHISENIRGAIEDVLWGADAYHRIHTARLARTVDLLYKARPTGKMLELGTSGFIPLVCKELFPGLEIHATHFDKSNAPGQMVQLSVGEQSMNVYCYNIDLEQSPIPVPNETYDIVLCCEVLEHMEIDPMFMLSEVNRVLKPGGRLILTTPNITSSRAIAKILSGVEPYFYMQYHKDRSYNRHNYEYSAPSLRRLLESAGFNGDVWSEDLFEDGLTSVVDSLRCAGYPLMEAGDNLLANCVKTGDVVDRHPVGIYI